MRTKFDFKFVLSVLSVLYITLFLRIDTQKTAVVIKEYYVCKFALQVGK